jgi:hypothetical protein
MRCGDNLVLLRYDFDILRTPSGDLADVLPRAVFRDADTRAAVQTLPGPVRQWLTGAGFDDGSQPSTLPPGQYAPQDELFRLQIMQRLTATMKDFDLSRAGADTWTTFVISDFVDSMANAVPAPEGKPAFPAEPAPQIPGPFAGLRGKAAKDALAKAAPRRWHPKQAGIPFGMLALARRQGFLKLTLGTAFVYCAVLLYLYR